MIASGALAPLTGFMGQADYDGDGRDDAPRRWPAVGTPGDAGDVTEWRAADRIALEGTRAVTCWPCMDVAEVFEADRQREAEKVYRTTEEDHPGVARCTPRAQILVGGPIKVFERPEPDVPRLRSSTPRDPRGIRGARLEPVVGFQTRNPVHRAHEYIQKCAMEIVDGLLLHPLVGETKDDDIPADVRMRVLRGAAGRTTTRPTACCWACSRPRCATPGRARRSSTRSAQELRLLALHRRP